MCIIIEKACKWCGLFLGIWEIDPSVEKMAGQEDEVDIAYMFKHLADTVKLVTKRGDEDQYT